MADRTPNAPEPARGGAGFRSPGLLVGEVNGCDTIALRRDVALVDLPRWFAGASQRMLPEETFAPDARDAVP